MPAPNAQLEAALNQFGNEPGVTPQQVNQLRAAIVATPTLLRAYNQDAANGHLQGFTLASPGPESIGRYDVASSKITIPSEVLTGTSPINPDLRAVLKLQDMSVRFAHTPGVTADMHDNLQKTINESPVLVDQFKDAVRNENQRHLRSFDLNVSTGAGGSYDPSKLAMNLTPASLTPATFDQSNLTFVLGHEMEHGFNRLQLQRSRDAYVNSLRTIAGDSNPINDYTAPALTRMQAHRTDEAESHIAGWNAMVSHERQRSGNPNVTLQDMWNNANRGRVEDFLVLDASGNAVARPGLTFNADNSLTPTPGPTGNVEAMGRYYFDQPVVGTPGVAPGDTMNLGPFSHSDYRNIYGAGVVSDAIWAEQAIAVPKHGNASQMRLNMQRLGLSEALLEENGLFITAGSTASQAYRDTSTTPPTVGRFDHTYDGPNKNQHVPVDMPMQTGEMRMSGPGGTNRKENEPEQTTALMRPQPAEVPLLLDPAHKGHPMYLQTLRAFDESPNIPVGTFTQEQKERLAAAIVAQGVTQKDSFPKTQVDHVVFNEDRSMVIGVQGGLSSPANHLAGVNVQRGLTASIEQSSETSQVAIQSMQQKQERVQAQSQNVDAPTTTGPVMRLGSP